MSHTNDQPVGPELPVVTQPHLAACDDVDRVRVRAHRRCGLLTDQRSEGGSSQQDDGWYYFVQRRFFMQRDSRQHQGQRAGRHSRYTFGFTRPPVRATASTGGGWYPVDSFDKRGFSQAMRLVGTKWR